MDLRLDTHTVNGEEVFEFIVDEAVPRTHCLVSSVRLWRVNSTQTRILFWNRGAATSTEWSVVRTQDALTIVARLFGLTTAEFATVVTENLRAGF